MTADPRELDLVVWGATGYTGRLVAEAVARRAPAGLRWAVAGRDPARLEAVRAALGPAVAGIVADAHDDASLAAMVRRTRAVVTTVGPYARHGTPLAAACARAGTDCADLAGEPLWMRRVIDRFDATARGSGARLVHGCGFDSLPSDLGVWRLQTEALRRHGRPCREILHLFGPMAGGVSGGTVASVLALSAEAAEDPAARRALEDPELLAPGAARSTVRRESAWPQRLEPRGAAAPSGWTAPFAMAMVNAKVVRRTRALLGEPWGDGLVYRERLYTTTWARAAAVGAGTAVAPFLLALAPVRWAARRLAPRPGAGPDERVRGRGHFRTTLVGHVDDRTDAVVASVEADLDPGYGASARMLAEVGLGLALGEFAAVGGVTTPAAVCGMRLLQRLDAAGIHLRVEPPRGG